MSIQFCYQSSIVIKNITKVKQLLQTLAITEGFYIDSLTIVFTSDEFLYEMNVQYLKHDYYTDIITFDLSERINKRINGELYISIDRAKENAKEHKVAVQDELRRLMIHGLLHLCGYHDKHDTEKQEMTNKEDFYLNML